MAVNLLSLTSQGVNDNSRLCTLEDSGNAQGISPPMSWKPDAPQTWLLEHAKYLKENVPPFDVDIFAAGFNSALDIGSFILSCY